MLWLGKHLRILFKKLLKGLYRGEVDQIELIVWNNSYITAKIVKKDLSGFTKPTNYLISTITIPIIEIVDNDKHKKHTLDCIAVYLGWNSKFWKAEEMMYQGITLKLRHWVSCIKTNMYQIDLQREISKKRTTLHLTHHPTFPLFMFAKFKFKKAIERGSWCET